MKTSNALASNIRTGSVGLLNARVADAIDLALATKQAHWNLRGPQFIAVHKMLDVLRADLDGYVDTMAERATALGGVALGTVQTVAKASTLTAYPTTIHAVPEHLKALAERTAATGNAVRKNIDEADEAGDAATADVFTEVARGLDKWLWMIESHNAA